MFHCCWCSGGVSSPQTLRFFTRGHLRPLVGPGRLTEARAARPPVGVLFIEEASREVSRQPLTVHDLATSSLDACPMQALPGDDLQELEACQGPYPAVYSWPGGYRRTPLLTKFFPSCVRASEEPGCAVPRSAIMLSHSPQEPVSPLCAPWSVKSAHAARALRTCMVTSNCTCARHLAAGLSPPPPHPVSWTRQQ